MNTEPQISDKEMAAYRWTQLKLDYHKRACEQYAAGSKINLDGIPAHNAFPIFCIGVFVVTLIILAAK